MSIRSKMHLFRIASDGFLNSPAVANGRIYIRDPRQLICYYASPPPPLTVATARLQDPNGFRITIG